METVMLLASDGEAIRLDIDEGENVCRFTFIVGRQSRDLGWDDADVSIRTLLAAVLKGGTGPDQGKSEGIPWWHLQNLAEPHSSLYVSALDRGPILLWQDKWAKPIATITLNERIRQRWLSQLEQVQSRLR